MNIGTLNRGSYFGESQILKQQSLNYFGDVIAGKNPQDKHSKVTFIKLSREDFERIPYYERKRIIEEHWR